MKFKEKAHLSSVENIFETEKSYVVHSHEMLEFFSKQDMKKTMEVSDYMGNCQYLQDEHSPYLVEITELRKIRIRDKKTMEILCDKSEIVPFFMPFRACFSLEGDKLLVIAANPSGPTYPFFFYSLIREQYQFRLFVLSLPDLEIISKVESNSYSFYDIQRIDFLDSYLLTDKKNNHYMLNSQFMVSFASLPLSRHENEKLIVNNVRKEFYVPSKYGVKIYDENFEEKDSLLLFENEPIQLDSVYSGMYHNTGAKNIFETPVVEEFRKYIGEICVFKEDCLLYTINDMLTLTCKVMVYSLSDNTQQEITELCDSVQYLYPFKDGFCFAEKQNGHIMEVIDG